VAAAIATLRLLLSCTALAGGLTNPTQRAQFSTPPRTGGGQKERENREKKRSVSEQSDGLRRD
jgi:hypothetical protein